MLRIRIIGMALVAVFALSAVAVASASAAENEWSLSKVDVTSTMSVTSKGTLKLTDTSVPIAGSVTVTCEGTNAGTVLPGGKDTITTITATSCTSNNSFCTSPTAKAVNLPWTTQLKEKGTRDLIMSANGKAFGWLVDCETPLGKKSDECTRAESSEVEVKNTSTGVDSIFSKKVSGLAKCTESGKETGEVEGTVETISGESGKLLEALT